MLTTAEFRDRYPEFANTPETLVSWSLDNAYASTPANVWGCRQDEGAALLCAHNLALSPMARDMRLADADGDTLYGKRRAFLEQVVASGNRIAGLPSSLESANDSAVATCELDSEDGGAAGTDVVVIRTLADLPEADADGLIQLLGADSTLYLVDGHIDLEGAALVAPGGGVGLAMKGRRGSHFDGFYSDVDPAVKPEQVAVLQCLGDQMDPNSQDRAVLEGLNFSNTSTVAETQAIALVAFAGCEFRDVSITGVSLGATMPPGEGYPGARVGVLVQCASLVWEGGFTDCSESVLRLSAYFFGGTIQNVWSYASTQGADGPCFVEMDSAFNGQGLRVTNCVQTSGDSLDHFLRILDGATIFSEDLPHMFHGCLIGRWDGVWRFAKEGAGFIDPYDRPGHFFIQDVPGVVAMPESQEPQFLEGRLVEVTGEGDLPAAVGGVITLEEDTHYQIVGGVTLTDGNYLVASDGTTIAGYSLDVDIITGNVSGGCLLSINSSINSRHKDVSFVNTSTDAGSSAVCQDGAASVATFDRCSFTGRATIQSANGLATVLRSCVLVTSGAFGIEVDGTLDNLLIRDCSIVMTATGAIGIDLAAAAVLAGIVTVETTRFVFLGASQVGINQDAGAALDDGLLFRNIFSGAGTNVQGFDHSSTEWTFQSNDGGDMIDSAAAGGSYNSNGLLTVAIGVQGTYYPITDGSTVAYSLQPDSERFALTDNETGEVTYRGKELRHVMISGSVTAARSSGSGGLVFAVQLFLNGVAVAGSLVEAELDNRLRAMPMAPVAVELDTDDTLELRIANLDSTVDADVKTATLSVISSR